MHGAAGDGAKRGLTMEDVAKAAGVSRALVSIVFRGQPGASDATRTRVLEVARELGYQPNADARRLAAGTSRTLGVVFTLRNIFHTGIVEGIYTRAEAAGFDVILSGTGPERPEDVAVSTLIAGRCAGAVLLGPRMGTDQLAELNTRLPCVVVGELPRPLVCDSIYTDDAQGVHMSLDYLYGLGHRDIAYVSGGSAYAMQARVRAFQGWMDAHGLGGEARMVRGSDTERGGMAAGEVLVALRRPPTAVLAANDRCALGLLAVLRISGIDVPTEMSVMGFDDIELSQFGGIPLSTVHQDSTALASRALGALVERLANPERTAQSVCLGARLVVRSTTGPPPG